MPHCHIGAQIRQLTAPDPSARAGKPGSFGALLVQLTLGLSCLLAQAADHNWPQFRGPNASGVADAVRQN
jgi:hypothetical protein